MPVPIERDDLHQKAVLWLKTGTDRYGRPVTGTPVQINVRWEWVSGLSISAASQVAGLDATVACDREVPLEARMWLGELADWYGSGSDTLDDEVCEVVRKHTTPDIKNRSTRHVVGLKKLKDSPTG